MFKVVIFILILVTLTAKTANKKNPVFKIQPIQLSLNESKPFAFKNIDEDKTLMINVEIPKEPTKFTPFEITVSDNKTKLV